MLFDVDQEISCTACHKPVYTVRKQVTTKTKLSELPACLMPYSPAVPMLTEHTEVKKIAPAAVHCPLCNKEWGVVLYG